MKKESIGLVLCPSLALAKDRKPTVPDVPEASVTNGIISGVGEDSRGEQSISLADISRPNSQLYYADWTCYLSKPDPRFSRMRNGDLVAVKGMKEKHSDAITGCEVMWWDTRTRGHNVARLGESFGTCPHES
jgi:hypothetical protein